MDIRSFLRHPLAPEYRRTLIITTGITLTFALVIGFTLATYFHHRDATVACSGVTCATATPILASSSPTPTATPQLVPAALDGTMVSPGKDNLRPLAVIIENHPDARPQSGLSSAGLVYEAMTEGGITRFLAVFTDPTKDIRVGPIRSARTYFVDMVTELNALFAHVGGNADALDQISGSTIADLNQFSVGAPTYARDTSRNVATEHTMYSSTASLWNYATTTKKYSSQADFTAWQFVDDASVADRPTAQEVKINFSSSEYAVKWEYDPKTNLYTRYLAGSPHIDANTGTAITTKNIVLQTVDRREIRTRINEDGWTFTLTGSGKATIIENGKATPATWKKEGTNRTRYYDSAGKEITFVRGTTWVEFVHPDVATTITP